jgi:hypothetical protein
MFATRAQQLYKHLNDKFYGMLGQPRIFCGRTNTRWGTNSRASRTFQRGRLSVSLGAVHAAVRLPSRPQALPRASPLWLLAAIEEGSERDAA